MAVVRATYRALLREARRMEAAADTTTAAAAAAGGGAHADAGVVYLHAPVNDADLARYGRGRYIAVPPPPPPPPPPQAPQAPQAPQDVALPAAVAAAQADATRELQAAWFPGVDFAAAGAAHRRTLTGGDVRRLVRGEFRRRGAGHTPDAALRALANLNALRAAAGCARVTYTPYGSPGCYFVTDVTTAPAPDGGGDGAYRFVYRIRLFAIGSDECQLVGRHWIFTDAAGGSVEVPRGSPGVVGSYPTFHAGGAGFEYVSGTELATPTGTMAGSLQVAEMDTSVMFDAGVAATALRGPPQWQAAYAAAAAAGAAGVGAATERSPAAQRHRAQSHSAPPPPVH